MCRAAPFPGSGRTGHRPAEPTSPPLPFRRRRARLCIRLSAVRQSRPSLSSRAATACHRRGAPCLLIPPTAASVSSPFASPSSPTPPDIPREPRSPPPPPVEGRPPPCRPRPARRAAAMGPPAPSLKLSPLDILYGRDGCAIDGDDGPEEMGISQLTLYLATDGMPRSPADPTRRHPIGSARFHASPNRPPAGMSSPASPSSTLASPEVEGIEMDMLLAIDIDDLPAIVPQTPGSESPLNYGPRAPGLLLRRPLIHPSIGLRTQPRTRPACHASLVAHSRKTTSAFLARHLGLTQAFQPRPPRRSLNPLRSPGGSTGAPCSAQGSTRRWHRSTRRASSRKAIVCILKFLTVPVNTNYRSLRGT